MNHTGNNLGISIFIFLFFSSFRLWFCAQQHPEKSWISKSLPKQNGLCLSSSYSLWWGFVDFIWLFLFGRQIKLHVSRSKKLSNGLLSPNNLLDYRIPFTPIYLSSFLLLLLHFFLNFILFVRSDYLRISDGRDRIVGTYCGYQTGKSLRVVRRTAVLKFVSNQVVRYHGFSLSFIFTPKGKFSNASTASYILTFCGRPAKPRQLLSIPLSRPMAWVN